MTKICKRDGCTTPIQSENRTRTYCSRDCRLAVADEKYERIICGNSDCRKQFKALIREGRKYCSQTCGAIVNNADKPKRKPKGKCKVCSVVISARRSLCDTHAYYRGYGTAFLEIDSEGRIPCRNAECPVRFIPSSSHRVYCSDACVRRIRKGGKVDQSYKQVPCPDDNCTNMKTKSARYCQECTSKLRILSTIEKWLSGEYAGGSVHGVNPAIRRYLLKEVNYSCSQCSFNTPHPDGSSILEIDHINGDSADHSPSNVRVLCPNCHALTPTHRARNTGKGRRTYYKKITPKDLDKLDVLDDDGQVVVG